MTFFFFVVGLEARREFDLGELRERRRFALPLLAGIAGMAVAASIYLAFNAGRSSASGWGIAMSTDTAFALGLLALVGPRFPDRLRAFMLTVVVVDDILALDEALERLKADDERKARIVSLRFFAGLSVDEVATVVDRSPRSVARDWAYARAWLYRELGGQPD